MASEKTETDDQRDERLALEAQIEALESERESLIMRGRKDRVGQVDAELKRLGVGGKESRSATAQARPRGADAEKRA